MDLDPQSQSPEVLPREAGTVVSLDMRRQGEGPPWSGWDVILIVFVALLAIAAFSVAGLVFATRWGSMHAMSAVEIARKATFIVPVQTAAYLFVVGFMYLLVRRGYGRPFWRTVGWKWPGSRWIYAVGGVLLAVAIELLSLVVPIPKSLPIEHLFNTPADAYVMAVFGITVAPLVEELFFRGFLYPALARRLGIVAGILITAFAFALIHASQLGHAWGPVLLLFIVGAALTVTRAKTASVAASFLVHVGYNLALFAMLYVYTDQFQHLEKMQR
ncbi:MAG: lysostaphin resistance A-like protein [Terriglobales bacterium]